VKRKLANVGFTEAKMSCEPCGGARLRDSAAAISGCTASGNLFANFTSDAGSPPPAMNSSITEFHRSRPPEYAGDNSAMKSFFSSLSIERVRRAVYRTREDARAGVFDYVERYYNPYRRHSTLGYVSPADYEQAAGLAQDGVGGNGKAQTAVSVESGTE
jgi:hypothetical protein